jgi:serine/threonine-protein kinase
MPDELGERHRHRGQPAPLDRWQEVSKIVDGALELPVEERSGFLARACPTAELRLEVDRFLRACERSGAFLDGAAAVFAAPLLAETISPRALDEAATLAQLRVALAGRYSIERELGRGGMAIVYLARDIRNHRDVAVKLLRPELALALGAERFLREIDTASRLTHPNILPVLESGEAQGLLYYVMPYVAGDTLRERLDRDRQLPVDEALHIARHVADALGYAHRQNVLHRDLKPENVLLANGQAVIADFGIACAIKRAAGRSSSGKQAAPLTGAGVSLGTPAYMSPEQALGSRALDGRSDIYAVGCILYEMIAGQPPFTGPTAVVIRQHVAAPAPKLTECRTDLDPAIARAVARALSKSPADRFDTMIEFANALTSPESTSRMRSDLTLPFGRALNSSRARRLLALALFLTTGTLWLLWAG